MKKTETGEELATDAAEFFKKQFTLDDSNELINLSDDCTRIKKLRNYVIDKKDEEFDPDWLKMRHKFFITLCGNLYDIIEMQNEPHEIFKSLANVGKISI